ncbi:MAG: hypothetical protein RLZZ273_1195 [Bacteroidota bacterium]|jgi:septum formation protein
MVSLNTLLNIPCRLVLASQSPRRSALMRHVGFSFDTIVPNVDEDSVPTSMQPSLYVEHLALLKASAAAAMVSENAIIIGSDTTVVLDGAVLNKPRDASDACRMLRRLSGRTHTVHTGLALVHTGHPAKHVRVSSRATHVTFRELSDSEIQAYVASGSPLDKAGAYGIQDDFGAVFVHRVEGCYYTIVGLPLELLYTELRELVKGL